MAEIMYWEAVRRAHDEELANDLLHDQRRLGHLDAVPLDQVGLRAARLRPGIGTRLF